MPVPDLTKKNAPGLPRPRTGRPSHKVARAMIAVLLVLMFAVSVLLLVVLSNELTYRAGWNGVAGTVSAASCETQPSSRGENVVCTGMFISNDANPVPALVTVEGSNSLSGSVDYPAQLHQDGQTASLVGAKPVVGILAGVAGALTIAVFFGGYCWPAVLTALDRWRGRMWRFPLYLAGGFGLLAIAGSIISAILTVPN